eukprot:scaffold13889_cov178-Amphora_coffeaeformis.AAC.5
MIWQKETFEMIWQKKLTSSSEYNCDRFHGSIGMWKLWKYSTTTRKQRIVVNLLFGSGLVDHLGEKVLLAMFALDVFVLGPRLATAHKE